MSRKEWWKAIISEKALCVFAMTSIGLATGVTVSHAASNEISKLAENLTTLRGEVESLSDGIEQQKNETRARLRSLTAQEMDLDMQVQKESLRLKQLELAREKHLAEVRSGDEARGQLRPVILGGIERARAAVTRGLPFKKAERLGELDRLEEQIKKELLTPEKGGIRLWQFIEDEVRLTRESGLYRQTITLGGEEILSDVARVGMVALYFKTADGRLGHVERDGDDWKYIELDGEQERAQIENLFDAFQKNIRVGFFQVPNGLVFDASREGGAR